MLYPDCDSIKRNVMVGGLSKEELIDQLESANISLNAYGLQLLNDPRFVVSGNKYELETVEIKVSDLGFPEGATYPELYERAEMLGLTLCPLELGAFLRLQFLDQTESSHNDGKKHQAPSDSITIASQPIDNDDNFPKGFYIRNIDGELWLRGYICDDLHVFGPDNHFIFCK